MWFADLKKNTISNLDQKRGIGSVYIIFCFLLENHWRDSGSLKMAFKKKKKKKLKFYLAPGDK